MSEPESLSNKETKQAKSSTSNKPKVGRPKSSTNDGGITLSKQLAAKKSRNTRKAFQTKGTSLVSPQKRNIQSSQPPSGEDNGEPLLKCRRLHFTAEENKENHLHLLLSLKPKHKEADPSIKREINNSSLCSQRRSFSPIPSTSTDTVTIEENEKRFNESLNAKNNGTTIIESNINKPTITLNHSFIDVDEEITPIKTSADKLFPTLKNDSDCIILDEVIAPKTEKCISQNISKHDDVEIIEIPYETITLGDYPHSSTPHSMPHKKFKRNCSPVMVDDYDSCLDLNPSPNVSDDEIIDIDALIAKNESCLEKYRNENKNLHTVTCIEANSGEAKQRASSPGTSASKNEEAINQNKKHQLQKHDKIDSVAGIINNFFEDSLPCSESSNNNFTARNDSITNNTMENRISDNVTNANNHSITQTTHNNSSVQEIMDDFFSNYNNRPQSVQSQQNIQVTNLNHSVVEIDDSISSPSRHNDSSVVEIINSNSANAIPRPRQNVGNNRPRSYLPQTVEEFEVYCSKLISRNTAHDVQPIRVASTSSIPIPSSSRTINQPAISEVSPQKSPKGRPRQNVGNNRPRSYLPQTVEEFEVYCSKLISQNTAHDVQPIRVASTSSIPIPSSSRTINQPAISEVSPQKSPKGIGDCPICMESLSGTAIASTLCGHVFCLDCIKRSIITNGKKCPTCRKALKKIGYHQLFL